MSATSRQKNNVRLSNRSMRQKPLLTSFLHSDAPGYLSTINTLFLALLTLSTLALKTTYVIISQRYRPQN